ncbi:hypothetical protein NQ176_g3386 [Zarea fungicola]|uniref:Uncharacterized protein n=1 Tax=Zarea fungicola TaxID=93591 RepID=A0ACC1NJU2_9HYPO|nr:hypothetical protein NQ176_g3386 [Lecanicillium fungicola]
MLATYIDREDIFSEVAKKSRDLINVADADGRTTVMYAAFLGHTVIARELVDKYGAQLGHKDQGETVRSSWRSALEQRDCLAVGNVQ